MDEGNAFPATRWSVVAAACDQRTVLRVSALEHLLSGCRPTFVAYVKRVFRFDHDVAEDLVQGFITDGILRDGLLSHAHAERGKLRNLLTKALNNYVISHIRGQKAQKRAPDVAAISLDDTPGAIALPSTQDDEFTREWTGLLVRKALDRMQAHCIKDGREDLWGLFSARLAKPLLNGDREVPYDELVASHGLKSPSQAFNLLNTGKRMFRRFFEEAVAETLPEGDDIEAEINDLLHQISKDGKHPLDFFHGAAQDHA